MGWIWWIGVAVILAGLGGLGLVFWVAAPYAARAEREEHERRAGQRGPDES